ALSPSPRSSTSPTTMSWSPAAWIASVRHENQAAHPSTTAAPETRSRACGTRASWSKAGRPGDASQSATGAWSSASTERTHASCSSRASRTRASAWTQNSTSAGSSDTEATALTVPARSRPRTCTLTTPTPAGKRPIAVRKRSASTPVMRSVLEPSARRGERQTQCDHAAKDPCVAPPPERGHEDVSAWTHLPHHENGRDPAAREREGARPAFPRAREDARAEHDDEPEDESPRSHRAMHDGADRTHGDAEQQARNDSSRASEHGAHGTGQPK